MELEDASWDNEIMAIRPGPMSTGLIIHELRGQYCDQIVGAGITALRDTQVVLQTARNSENSACGGVLIEGGALVLTTVPHIVSPPCQPADIRKVLMEMGWMLGPIVGSFANAFIKADACSLLNDSAPNVSDIFRGCRPSCRLLRQHSPTSLTATYCTLCRAPQPS